MPLPAETLEQAIQQCSPRPLSEKELEPFWVDTQEARDGMVSFRGNVRRRLEQGGTPKVLVYGHRGCGKSTELNKLISELPRSWLVVQFRAGDYLPVSGNQAADVLLAACVRLMEVAQERSLALSPESMRPVERYFSETVRREGSDSSASIEGAAGLDTQGGLLGRLFGWKVRLEGELRHGSRAESSTVQNVRRRKAELAAAVNALCLAAEEAWRNRHADLQAQLLLVVEDLDKLVLEDARRIFVQDGRLLSDVAIRAVYTIPIFAFHSADAGAIRAYFEHEERLPMIKVNGPGGEPEPGGRLVIRQIVRRRVAAGVLPDDALEVLIEQTGGVLRHVFQAIQTAAQFLPVIRAGRLDKAAVEEALRRMVADIGLQIAYPPSEKGEARDPKPLQERLAKIAQTQARGERVVAQPDPELQLLLMSGALLEYNGEGWLGVHPLAKRYLEDLGFPVSDGTRKRARRRNR